MRNKLQTCRPGPTNFWFCRYRGELKSLRAQSFGEVSAYQSCVQFSGYVEMKVSQACNQSKGWLRPCMSRYYVKYTVDSTRIIGYLFFHKITDDMCLTYKCMPYHKQSVTFYLVAQKEIKLICQSYHGYLPLTFVMSRNATAYYNMM